MAVTGGKHECSYEKQPVRKKKAKRSAATEFKTQILSYWMHRER